MMSEEAVRICVIGCGAHSMSNLQPAMGLIPRLEYVAACDLIEERVKEAVRRYAAKKAYTDFTKMLDEEKPDAVVVCGLPDMQEEVSIECLKRGVHVFTEKPTSYTVEGAKRLMETMRATGKFCMVATMWRHMPVHTMMKQVMQREEFGELVRVSVDYLTPDRAAPWGLPYDWEFMIGQAIHPVDCIQFLAGRISEVRAMGEAVAGRKLVYIVMLKFESGAWGSLILGGCVPTLYVRVGVHGTGGIWMETENQRSLRFVSRQPWQEPGGYGGFPYQVWQHGDHYRGVSRPGYVEELEHFTQCILSSTPPRADAEDAYQAMRVLEAILHSAEARGETVKVVL